MPSNSGEEMITERFQLIILTFMAVLFGIFFSTAWFLAPVPLALIVARHQLRTGILTALGAGALVGLFLGPGILIQVILVLSVGIAIGEAVRDKLSFGQILTVTTGVTYLAFVLLYVVTERLAQVDLMEEWMEALSNQLTALFSASADSAGVAQELSLLLSQIRMMLPGWFFLLAAMISTVDYWIAGRWMKRLDMKVPWFPSFSHWRFPWYYSWGYIAGIGLPIVARLWNLHFLLPVAANLELVFSFLYVVQGLAVIWFYMGFWHVPKVPAIIICLLISLYAPLPIFIGLLDVWFNLRRLKQA
ncbi:MAG TPA: DUF2232 domain-containing protein [Firmicutes bacterium]|jgi:uncharacterized protein YybS (DUF2232 family)|nr:DUF2232 domain-containing protein [Bacillota bacterium]